MGVGVLKKYDEHLMFLCLDYVYPDFQNDGRHVHAFRGS
jgi:hypothetical protein